MWRRNAATDRNEKTEMTTQRERRYFYVLSWAAVGTLLVSLVLPGVVQRAEAALPGRPALPVAPPEPELPPAPAALPATPPVLAALPVFSTDCGRTLSGANTYVLTADMVCPGDPPALTLEGPATLELNGWSITCVGVGATTGVDIIGKGATLLGAGTTEPDTANPNPTNEIRNCEEDVAVAGDGEHLVKGVTATGLLADS